MKIANTLKLLKIGNLYINPTAITLIKITHHFHNKYSYSIEIHLSDSRVCKVEAAFDTSEEAEAFIQQAFDEFHKDPSF